MFLSIHQPTRVRPTAALCIAAPVVPVVKADGVTWLDAAGSFG